MRGSFLDETFWSPEDRGKEVELLMSREILVRNWYNLKKLAKFFDKWKKKFIEWFMTWVLNPTFNHSKHYQYFVTLTQWTLIWLSNRCLRTIIWQAKPSLCERFLFFCFCCWFAIHKKKTGKCNYQVNFFWQIFLVSIALHLNSNYCLICNLSNY